MAHSNNWHGQPGPAFVSSKEVIEAPKDDLDTVLNRIKMKIGGRAADEKAHILEGAWLEAELAKQRAEETLERSNKYLSVLLGIANKHLGTGGKFVQLSDLEGKLSQLDNLMTGFGPEKPAPEAAKDLYAFKKSSKPPLAKLSPTFMEEMALVCRNGDEKHSDCTWINSPLSWSEIASAAMRHINQFMQGNFYDAGADGDGLHHLAHAATCCMFLFHYSVYGGGTNDLRFSDRPADSMARVLGDIVSWSNSVFPDREPEHALRKLADEEIQELLEDPADPGELADVLILALDLCHLNGVNPAKAIADKMAKNKARKWARTSNGTIRHVEEI